MIGKRSSSLRVFPEQEIDERLRPVILYGETAAERAKAIGGSPRTLHAQAKRFEEPGMLSLFHKAPSPPAQTERSLRPEMRQLIVDLRAERPDFTPHEIATICFLHVERRPSDHYVIGVEERDGTNSLRQLLIYSVLRHIN